MHPVHSACQSKTCFCGWNKDIVFVLQLILLPWCLPHWRLERLEMGRPHKSLCYERHHTLPSDMSSGMMEHHPRLCSWTCRPVQHSCTCGSSGVYVCGGAWGSVQGPHTTHTHASYTPTSLPKTSSGAHSDMKRPSYCFNTWQDFSEFHRQCRC